MEELDPNFAELLAISAFEGRYSEPTSSDILMVDVSGDERHIINGTELNKAAYVEKFKSGKCKKNSWADIQPFFVTWLRQAYGEQYLGFNSFSFRKEKHLKSDWGGGGKTGDVYGTLIVDTPVKHVSSKSEKPFFDELIALTKNSKYITPSSVLFGNGAGEPVIEKCLFFRGSCPNDLKANINNFGELGLIIVETFVNLTTRKITYNILCEEGGEVEVLKSRLVEVGIPFAYTLLFYILSAQNAQEKGDRADNNCIVELEVWYATFLRCEVLINRVDEQVSSLCLNDHCALFCIAANRDRFSSVVTLSPFRYVDLKAFLVAYKQVLLTTKLLGGNIDRNRLETVITELERSSVRSAIGSIMSRNGSHNIGSHVLSALTHNVGTMPDDRVLYQYIQHRMDYIATATTGFPDWGVPTMFVGEIMRNFMTQHHLLDYIVESEGLHAYHFQGHKANSSENEKNTLRLKIVAKVGSEHRPFVDYGEGDIKQDVPLSDVCVSIPGGVAGHHAVYTILENVIRNAAKHGWARPDKRESLDNLEVTVEFEDVPKDDRVLVTVYDNAPLPDEEAVKLVHSLNAKLKEKLISEETDGALRKENWGLAEMRISAAYLQQRTLPETGGLSELKDGDHIISAAVIKNGNDGCSHLGYQFFIRKPQEMLIVIPCGWKDVIKNLKANRGTAAKILALSGIRTAECKDDECFDIITGNKLQSFRYAYVVLPRQPKRQLLRSGAYPFRLLVLGGSGSLVWKPPMKKGVYDRYDREPIGPRMLPSLSPYVKEIRKLLQEVGGKSADDNCTSGFNGVDKAAFDLRTIVYNVWIQYLDKRTRTLVKLKKCDGECLRDSGKRDLNIYIDTEGGESNSGRELLSDRDVCIYLLDHSYRTILEALNKVIGKEVEKIESTEEKEAVQHQVASLFDGLEKVCFDKSTLGYDMHVRDMMRQVADQVLTLAKVGDLLEDLKRQGFNIRETLIDFLVGAFSATDAMLRKYSERIDTLPKHFCVGASTGSQKLKDTGSQKPKDKDGCDVLDGVKVISKIKAGTDKGSQDCTITYQRHAGDAIRNVYASGLSGSQSCFSQFKRFESDCNVQNKQSMLARLVENALLRILIIDERVFKFLSIRPRSLSKLSRMNVWAVNTNMTQSEESGGEGKTESTKETCDVKDGGNHKTRSCLTVNWDHWKRVNEDGKGGAAGCQQLLPAGVFDVLVIHQGIIDKVLGNKCTKKQVELMLERLKKVVPYVVITTGRGRPTNTPASARILPFSCVERYLFQEWPEKFLLVNAIMNLLPCGE